MDFHIRNWTMMRLLVIGDAPNGLNRLRNATKLCKPTRPFSEMMIRNQSMQLIFTFSYSLLSVFKKRLRITTSVSLQLRAAHTAQETQCNSHNLSECAPWMLLFAARYYSFTSADWARLHQGTPDCLLKAANDQPID